MCLSGLTLSTLLLFFYYSFFFFSSVNPLTWGFCEEQSSASLSLLLDFAIPISDNNTQMKRAVTFMDKDDCKIVLKFPFFSPLDSGHIVSRIDLFIVMPSMRILDEECLRLCQTFPQKCTCKVTDDCTVESQLLCSFSSSDLDTQELPGLINSSIHVVVLNGLY